MAHVLIGEPVPTSPEHALERERIERQHGDEQDPEGQCEYLCGLVGGRHGCCRFTATTPPVEFGSGRRAKQKRPGSSSSSWPDLSPASRIYPTCGLVKSLAEVG